MSNRIIKKLDELKRNGGKSLTVVLMIGDPNIDTTFDLIRIAVDAGVDCIEIGIPIADPFLDSQVMRKSMSRALAHTADYEVYIATLDKLRKSFPDTPFEVMIYHDTITVIGLDNFCNALVDCDMDAVLVADGAFKGADYRANIDKMLLNKGVLPIRFVPHPFNSKQVEDLRENAHGFIVVQTQADNKGQREVLLDENKLVLNEIRNAGIKLPLVSAYGIKTSADIQRCISMGSDGVLIGTAVLEAAYNLTRSGFQNFLTNLRQATAPI
jgi:tryptophan synthase alpha chain